MSRRRQHANSATAVIARMHRYLAQAETDIRACMDRGALPVTAHARQLITDAAMLLEEMVQLRDAAEAEARDAARAEAAARAAAAARVAAA